MNLNRTWLSFLLLKTDSSMNVGSWSYQKHDKMKDYFLYWDLFYINTTNYFLANSLVNKNMFNSMLSFFE